MRVIERFLREAKDFKKTNSVKAIVKCPLGKILIMRRQLDQPGEGNWDLPGGGIEENETQNNALIREVFEETGLKVSGIKKETTASLKIPETGVDCDMFIYVCSTDVTNVKLKPATWKGSDGKPEHSEYKWIKRKIDLENLTMLGTLKSVVMKHLE